MDFKTLTMTPVAALLELLNAELPDVRVAMDPSELVPPGVLVSLSGFSLFTLEGIYAPTALVRVVVPDAPQDKAAEELVAITNRLLEHLDPDGPITALGLVLPNDPAPLPCLSFPINLT